MRTALPSRVTARAKSLRIYTIMRILRGLFLGE